MFINRDDTIRVLNQPIAAATLLLVVNRVSHYSEEPGAHKLCKHIPIKFCGDKNRFIVQASQMALNTVDEADPVVEAHSAPLDPLSLRTPKELCNTVCVSSCLHCWAFGGSFLE